MVRIRKVEKITKRGRDGDPLVYIYLCVKRDVIEERRDTSAGTHIQILNAFYSSIVGSSGMMTRSKYTPIS